MFGRKSKEIQRLRDENKRLRATIEELNAKLRWQQTKEDFRVVEMQRHYDELFAEDVEVIAELTKKLKARGVIIEALMKKGAGKNGAGQAQRDV